MASRVTPAASRFLAICIAAASLLAVALATRAQERLLLSTAEPASRPAEPAQVGPRAKVQIHNPFYQTPAWRLWTQDDSPVAFEGQKSRTDAKRTRTEYAPPAAKDRKYPDFSDPKGPAGLPKLVHTEALPELAGWWDDGYMTLDGAHTNMPSTWSDGQGGSISISGQYIHVNYGYSFHPAARFALGCNFTSQSFAGRGRHIVDDTASNEETERFFFFANCLRATPSHASYEDKNAAGVHDAYDGLFGHSYQSLGQSGSETAACLKMMLAGGCLPRTTKDLLKLHGAYVIPLLTMFKAALPYADADGKLVPYQNELRHRPAYSSLGTIQHTHYCPVNPYYHAYDDPGQVGQMLAWARGMKAPPPIAILKMLDLTSEKGGKTVTLNPLIDDSIKSLNKTLAIIWGAPDETLTARVSLADSYDLTGRELTYEAYGVYPNHKNVAIQQEKGGVFRITVRHDPKLPKGRIPVVLFARNGTDVPSNPVFVNFYWPEPGELVNYNWDRRPPAGQKMLEVTRNLRPLVDFHAPYDTVFATPGQTLRVPLDAKDPEGFDIITYRWPGEAGRIEKGEYVLDVATDAPGGFYPVHLIFSDGTGGYTGRLLKVCVAPKAPTLPEGWSFSTVGIPAASGTVQTDGQSLAFAGVGAEVRGRGDTGSFAFRKVTGDFDIACRVGDLRVEGGEKAVGRIGLLARDRLEDFGLHGGAFARGNLAGEMSLTPCWDFRVNNWNRGRTDGDKTLATKAEYLRLIRHDKTLVALASSDGKTWEQLRQGGVSFGADCLVGVMVAVEGPRRGDANPLAGGTCTLVDPGSNIPLAVISGGSSEKPPKPDAKPAPVKVELLASGPTPAETQPAASTKSAGPMIRYTLDGSEPTEKSAQYTMPIPIETKGRTEVRARLYIAGKGGDVVVTVVNVE